MQATDLRKEAYFLAFLALLIAVYKIWRFYPSSPNISKLAYSAGIATAVYGLLTTVAEYELLKR